MAGLRRGSAPLLRQATQRAAAGVQRAPLRARVAPASRASHRARAHAQPWRSALICAPAARPQARVNAAKDKSKAPVVNVVDFGYFKVLGKGQLPEQPIVVKAKFVSKLAESKIKAVGGAVQLVA